MSRSDDAVCHESPNVLLTVFVLSLMHSGDFRLARAVVNTEYCLFVSQVDTQVCRGTGDPRAPPKYTKETGRTRMRCAYKAVTNYCTVRRSSLSQSENYLLDFLSADSPAAPFPEGSETNWPSRVAGSTRARSRPCWRLGRD